MIITTIQELEEKCALLSNASFVAIDTEFIREKTYYPKVCLIQVASEDISFCIDTLELEDLTPFFDLLSNQNITKVFHACEQDIEILYHLSGKVPSPIFDTQIAAMVCGFLHQVSYADLVFYLTEKVLDKGMRLTNWAMRPLTQKQLDYALDDVIYLVDVYKKITEILEQSGRAEWLKDEWIKLENEKRYYVDPCECWKKSVPPFKKIESLKAFAYLVQWREQVAQQENKMKRCIITDETIEAVALALPKDEEELKMVRGISNLKKTYIPEVLTVLKNAEEDQTEGWEIKKKNNVFAQRILLDLLEFLLAGVAQKEKVAKELIADKADLLKLIASPEEALCLQGWRRDIFGTKAIDFISGNLKISWDKKNKKVKYE